MVYAIGALAACLCIVVGIGMGYLIWGRPALLSMEERIDLQNEQLRLERQLQADPDAVTLATLGAITKKLSDNARRLEVRQERAARLRRRRLRHDLVRYLD